jgi:hypothetical protein
MTTNVAKHGTIGTLIPVLLHQVLIKLEHVHRSLMISPRLKPVLDYAGDFFRSLNLILAPIHSPLGCSLQVIPHRAFTHS